MQQQNIDYSNLFQVRKNTTSNRLYKKKSELHENLIPEKSENIIKPKNNRIPKNSEKSETNPQISRKSETNPQISRKFDTKSKRNIFIDIYNYRNKVLESKLSLLPKKFDYVEEDNKYQESMMLLNKEYEIKNDDINKIKFISFSEFKSKLLLSKIKEDLSLDFFFSKNKDFLNKIINKLYFNKNGDKYDFSMKKKLSTIIEENSGSKYGGMLEDVGGKFLSILSVLDRKHDFMEGVNADITKYIHDEGQKFITSKFSPATPQLNEILDLFASNKDYEEDILINTINHIMGNIPYQPYLSNANKLTSFAFIDVNDVMDKLQIYYKTLNETDSEINDINVGNIFNKLIEYISTFFNYDMTATENYKFIFDTDIKLHAKLKNATEKKKFHHNLYNKIGEQLFPFENAFDPHASNTITINPSNIKVFREITETNFNYKPPVRYLPDTKKTDYMFAVKNNVNNYLGFDIIQEGVTNNYFPCIILKKYNDVKMNNFNKYKNKIFDPSLTHFNTIPNSLNPAIIDYNFCSLSPHLGSSVQFYIDSILNNFKHTYIKYTCSSFTNIPILKEYIKRLIVIYNNSPNIKDDFDALLKEKDDEFDTKPYPGKIILHFIIGYLYYCNDKDPFNDAKQIIKEIIEILFDLKKAGDWGQALFCSEYNKKENINKKDCFFVTGDKLAAVRSLLCTNVKTILPVDYKFLSGVTTNRKRSIITLYRNRFDLTFKRFVNYIETSIFTLKPFEIFSKTGLKMEFFMKYSYIHSPTVLPSQRNKHDEIITDDNFNYDTFNIFINYLKYQMQIFLYLYTITLLNNDDKKIISSVIRSIDYNAYKKEEEEAIAKIAEINSKGYKNIGNSDYNEIVNHDAFDIKPYNMYYLFDLEFYSLKYFQDKYLSNVHDTIEYQQELLKNMETNLKKFIDKSIDTKFIELFNKDFDKSVSKLSNSISDCQQKLINICDIYYSYSLLLCDDRFINNDYKKDFIDKIENDRSQTSIKRIINTNNDEITKFFYTFSSFHLDKTKFKIIAKDFITKNIENLNIEKDELEEIKSELDKLKKYLDESSSDNNKNGKNLIIYFKSSIYGKTPENAAFLENIDNCIKEYWLQNPAQDFTLPVNASTLTPDDKALKEHYEEFVSSNYETLWIDLYDYFKIIYSQLFKGFDKSKITTDANKTEIANILTELYANESIKEINPYTKELTFTYGRTYDTIVRRLVKITHAISTNQSEFDAITQEAANIAAASAAAAASDAAAAASSDATPGKKRRNEEAASEAAKYRKPRYQQIIRDWNTAADEDKSKVKYNVITLFNKLRGGNKDFEYNADKFKDVITDTMPYASFLKQNVSNIHNRQRTPNEILSEIGFIIYIIEFFEKIILNRTPDIFKNINKYFSNVNSELINHIYKFRYDYYFDTDYVIIPIIYKYLRFIVKNKENFIFAKDESLFTYNKIYEKQYKNRIENILYNIDVLFNIVKDTPITEKERIQFLKSKQPAASSGRGRGAPKKIPNSNDGVAGIKIKPKPGSLNGTRGPGRPRKSGPAGPPKSGPAGPPKSANPAASSGRGRGRPRKSANPAVPKSLYSTSGINKKRGRPGPRKT